ncbi:hypothetical protein GGQ83_000491 [Roseococcus suduntuyensis]|uniref:Uncharacterized protein n=1 Tax=Roseococcus suduntuyensis TaxID=455361 RepID=A0A840AA60_9PROT|nr:hypothetical protein [Roseococcus suduntuyensis]
MGLDSPDCVKIFATAALKHQPGGPPMISFHDTEPRRRATTGA